MGSLAADGSMPTPPALWLDAASLCLRRIWSACWAAKRPSYGTLRIWSIMCAGLRGRAAVDDDELFGLLDPGRVGLIGHSAGGAISF